MIVYTREKLEHLLKIELVRFCIVGGLGFLINLAFLVTLSHVFKLPVFMAQFIGAEVSLFNNFQLHNRWTYKKHKVDKSISKLLVQFHATSWPAIVGSTVMVSAFVRGWHFSELQALAVSSAIAFFWNFTWSKYVVWRDITNKQIEEIVK